MVQSSPAARSTSGRLLSLRDRHGVEVLGEPELFVVFAMLVLQIDRREEAREVAFNNDT